MTGGDRVIGGSCRRVRGGDRLIGGFVPAPDGPRPDPAPTLSIILVTWNVRDLVLRCLESIHQRSGAVSFEVLIVDNVSSDGTIQAIRRQFPDVRVVENRENIGFPKANNKAFQVARGRYILFLNPDTEVGAGTLEACVAELERDAGIGMVSSRLEFPDGEIQYDCARNPYLLRHLLSEMLYLQMFFPRSRVFAHHLIGDWNHRATRDVEAICGAFMMVRRSVAEALGGLPDDVFMYHEDSAFCLRVRRAGWRIRYLADVVTIHYANQSSRQSSARLYLLEGEAKLRLIREAQGPAVAALGRLLFGVRSLLRIGVAGVGAVLPGLGAAKARYPRVFDLERHVLQLLWTVAPVPTRRRFLGV